jgi:GAF domain-containing protein
MSQNSLPLEASRQFQSEIEQLREAVDRLKRSMGGDDTPAARSDPESAATTAQLIDSVDQNLKRLNRHSEQILKRLAAFGELTETTALINSSLDPQEVINAVIDSIVEITKAERAFIVIEDSGALSLFAARNWDSQTLPESEVSFSHSIVTATLQDGKPVVTTNAQIDDRFGGVASIHAKMVRAVLCVPLISRGRTIGVIYADNRFAYGVFSPEIVEIVSTFVHQAAIAIENARRYERVRNDLEETKSQLMTLHIQIDEAMRQSALKDITENDYFYQLQGLVRAQRERRIKQNE